MSSPRFTPSSVLFAVAAGALTLAMPRVGRADLGPFPGADLQGTGGTPTLATSMGPTGAMQPLASVDLTTGDAQARFPFQLPTARGAVQPTLGLSYSSSRGVGFAGVGWSLDLPAIERRGASGMPAYDRDVLGVDGAGNRSQATATGARAIPTVTIDLEIPGIAIRKLKFALP